MKYRYHDGNGSKKFKPQQVKTFTDNVWGLTGGRKFKIILIFAMQSVNLYPSSQWVQNFKNNCVKKIQKYLIHQDSFHMITKTHIYPNFGWNLGSKHEPCPIGKFPLTYVVMQKLEFPATA